MTITGAMRGAALVVFVATTVTIRRSVQAQDAGLLAAWRDGETRTSYSEQTHETEAFFALIPSCAEGNPTLVFSAKYAGKEPTAPPPAISVRADVGMRTNPTFMRRQTLAFLVNPGARDKATIDVSGALHTPLFPAMPGETIDTAVADVSLPDVIRIAEAKALAIDVFGMDCTTTAAQLDRLRRFVESVLPRHRD